MAQVQEWSSSKRYAHLKVILLVTNDEANLNSLVCVLQQDVHYRVFVASSAFAAVKFLRNIFPHLLIVDDCLPDMTGIQLYDYLHANRRLASLPTIMLSARMEDVRDELATRQLIGFRRDADPGQFIAAIQAIFAASSSE